MILIQPPDPELAKVKKGGYAGKVVRHLCPAVLVYSAEDEAGDAKFDLHFIERVRRLEYRQFLFLPKGGPLAVDSIRGFLNIYLEQKCYAMRHTANR